jgi:hypothetical protein
MGQTESKEQ